MPKRIQRKRTKGWRMQEASSNPLGVVYVGRPTKWGNIARVGHHLHWSLQGWPTRDAADCVEFYRHWIVCQFTVEEIRRALRGKDLCCWCPLVDDDGNSVPCHADVLLELANA